MYSTNTIYEKLIHLLSSECSVAVLRVISVIIDHQFITLPLRKWSRSNPMAFQLPLQMKDNAGLIIVAVNLAMLVSANAEGQATAGKD